MRIAIGILCLLVFVGCSMDMNVAVQTFTGTAGNDTLVGTAGNDTFIASLGTDSYDGGGGSDTLSFAGLTEVNGVYVNLDTENSYNFVAGILSETTDNDPTLPKATGRILGSDNSDIGTMSIRSIENLVGGRNGVYVLIGDSGPNRLDAGDAFTVNRVKVLRGNGGSDTFVLSKSTGTGSFLYIEDFTVADRDMLDLSAFSGITEEGLTIDMSGSRLFVSIDIDPDDDASGTHGVRFINLAVTDATIASTFDTIKGNIIYASE